MAHHYAYMTKVGEVRESESYTKAAKDTNWHAATEEEMQALDANNTWDLVNAQKGVKAIGCKWVYKTKYNADNSVNRYKAQLVAKGYVQTHEIDYDETFAPVAKMMAVRVVLAVTATRGWHLHQKDVKTRFFKVTLKNKYLWSNPLVFIRKGTLR